jgi:hypothetical protein
MPHGVPKEPSSSHQQQLSNNSSDNNEFFFKNQFEMGQGSAGSSSYTGGMNQPFTPMTSPSPQQQMKNFGGSSNSSSSNLHGSNVAFSTQPPPQSPSKSRRSSKASNDKGNGGNGVGQNGGSSSFLDVQPDTMGSAMSKFSFSGRVPDLSSGFVPVDPYR